MDPAQLAEMKTKAEGVRKQGEGTARSGGRTMAKLPIAKGLKGKRIVLVPVGDGSGLRGAGARGAAGRHPVAWALAA